MKEKIAISGAEALRESSFVKEALVGMVCSAECAICHAVREAQYMVFSEEGWVCIDCKSGGEIAFRKKSGEVILV